VNSKEKGINTMIKRSILLLCILLVGFNITACRRGPEKAEEAINNGRADLIGIGRALLSDPQWPLTAAKELSISGMIPQPYKRAYPSSIS
jgi:2,4-dienoyl-CoA reductase-like NADH-dependent reductase (Old Yellow Enzyme family)